MSAIKPVMKSHMDAMEIVLLHNHNIPMNEVFVNRRVCKQWDALIKSDAFQRKVERSALKGTLVVSFSDYINSYAKDTLFNSQLKWQNVNNEPFIGISVYNEESLTECDQNHKPRCREMGYQGSWLDHYSRLPERFPGSIPIRLIMSKDPAKNREEENVSANEQLEDTLLPYQSKEAGGVFTFDLLKIILSYQCGNNQIHLVFKGKPIILTCKNPGDKDGALGSLMHQDIDRHRVTSLQDGLAYRINVSLVCKFITQAEVNTAKAAAAAHDKASTQAIRYKWIFSG